MYSRRTSAEFNLAISGIAALLKSETMIEVVVDSGIYVSSAGYWTIRYSDGGTISTRDDRFILREFVRGVAGLSPSDEEVERDAEHIVGKLLSALRDTLGRAERLKFGENGDSPSRTRKRRNKCS